MTRWLGRPDRARCHPRAVTARPICHLPDTCTSTGLGRRGADLHVRDEPAGHWGERRLTSGLTTATWAPYCPSAAAAQRRVVAPPRLPGWARSDAPGETSGAESQGRSGWRHAPRHAERRRRCGVRSTGRRCRPTGGTAHGGSVENGCCGGPGRVQPAPTATVPHRPRSSSAPGPVAASPLAQPRGVDAAAGGHHTWRLADLTLRDRALAARTPAHAWCVIREEPGRGTRRRIRR